MALAKYLEDIIERHLDDCFTNKSGSESTDTRQLSREEVRAQLSPLLVAIRIGLAQPEATHLMRAEEAEWDARKAGYNADRLSSDLTAETTKSGALEKRCSELSEKLEQTLKQLKEAQSTLSTAKQQALKNDAALRLDNERLIRERRNADEKNQRTTARLTKVMRDLEVQLQKKQDEVDGLETQVMLALVRK